MQTIWLPFDQRKNFLVPQLTKDKKPYGPIRYRDLMKESYYIIKNTSATYKDTLDMSPTERNYILSFLVEEAEKNRKATEERLATIQQNKTK